MSANAPSGNISMVKADQTRESMVCKHYASIGDLPAHFATLFDRAGIDNPFATRPWYQRFEQLLLAPHERAHIYAVETHHDNIVSKAILPMRCISSRDGLLRPRTLRSLSNYYTSLFEPVLAQDEQQIDGIVEAIARAMIKGKERWDTIDLHPLNFESPLFAALVRAFRHHGMFVQEYFCFGNWYLQVAGRSYATYLESLSSQTRNTIRRKSKQFASAPGSQIRVFREEAELDEGLRDYERVYATSWKSREPAPEFIREICRVWARLGWLRLGVAYTEAGAAAAQIWVVHGSTASIFKLAYDERFAKQSIGSVLTARLMQLVIDDDKVSEVDYLTGDDSYKRDWMSHRRERWGILAINPRTPQGLIAATRHLGGQAVKRALAVIRRPDRPTDHAATSSTTLHTPR